MALLSFPVMIICGIYLVRLGLILAGMYKDPILATFERYGDQDPFFYPLPGVLLALGGLIISTGFTLRPVLDWTPITIPLGIIFVLISGLATQMRDRVYEQQQHLPVLPRWYARLYNDTNRPERRRIAYMWLRLPLRTRLLYNVSNRFFFLWVDLVLAATVGEA
jgi:hypothetical protein